MARKKFSNLTIKMNPTIFKAFEKSLKDHNKRHGKKVYKVRVIEDLLFEALAHLGYIREDFKIKYIEERQKRQSHSYMTFLSDIEAKKRGVKIAKCYTQFL